MKISEVRADELLSSCDELVNLLRACVLGGASLGYLAPLPEPDAIEYWNTIATQVQSGSRSVLVARDGDVLVGSAQLAFEVSKPNGRHRAEVCKVMVLPSERGRGIATQLMEELERIARDRRLRLLFLDTSEGRGGAGRFYELLGYTYAGGIPEYALDPDGRPAKNAIYFKLLS
jgi:acetyltransferase